MQWMMGGCGGCGTLTRRDALIPLAILGIGTAATRKVDRVGSNPLIQNPLLSSTGSGVDKQQAQQKVWSDARFANVMRKGCATTSAASRPSKRRCSPPTC
jgi:hypothetical protein